MLMRAAMMAVLMLCAACQRTSESAGPGGADLQAPGREAETARAFAPVNDAAKAVTGELTLAISERLPDQANAETAEVMSLRAAKGLELEAALTGAVSPAQQVNGQTLRALMALAVEEPQTLVYRVLSENHPEGVSGLCAGASAGFVVVWEPTQPGEAGLKLMGVSGASLEDAGARACPLLEFQRP